MSSTPVARPFATVNLEPTGRRTMIPRPYAVRVTLRLSASGSNHADKAYVAGVAHRVLEGFAPAASTRAERTISEVLEEHRIRKTGRAGVVVGVEGTATARGRPTDDEVEEVRDALRAEGYRVAIRECRQCAEVGCNVNVVVDWHQASQVPRGWYSRRICGAHNYRTCVRCGSTYALSSTNSVGPAPSVHCEVCGLVIIEWGSSKIWHAELITRASK